MSLPLLASDVAKSTWIHYAEQERELEFDLQLEEGYFQKCGEAHHFAIDDRWKQFALGAEIVRNYTHKYKIANAAELKILDVSRDNVFKLLPLPLASWGMNWDLIRSRGYDGVYIHHDEIYYGPVLPPGYGRWRSFVHNFDVDTLVVWKGKLEQMPIDWPEVSPDMLKQIAERKELDDSIAKREAERDAQTANMSKPERDKFNREYRKQLNKSNEVAITGTEIEVDGMRLEFIGYDEHYPVRPGVN